MKLAKSSLLSATGCMLVFVAVATFISLPAHAGKKAVAAAAATPAGDAGKLDEAYGLLSRADHDYDGHRIHAMHLIEDAAKTLGQKLGGQGPGKEKQHTSDEQLTEARSILLQAVGSLRGKSHRHIEEAIKQLNVALRVR